MNGEVELEFCFYKTKEEEKFRADSFIFTLFDLDNRAGGLQERLTINTGEAERVGVSEVNEVRMWSRATIHHQPLKLEHTNTSKIRVESDNPQDPRENKTEQQDARSIEFRFKNTQCWTIKFEHFCPCEDADDDEDFCAQPGAPDCNSWCPKWKRGRCQWYSGANLVFGGKSEAQLPDDCPPPTTSLPPQCRREL